MNLRMLGMMLLSGIISLLGMVLGSVFAGGHAITLLQLLFPFVIVMHAAVRLYGMVGIATTLTTALVLTLDDNKARQLIVAAVCLVTWICITYPLDKTYIK